MQVYKAFAKIIYKNMGQIMIYIVVFVVLTASLANVRNSKAETSFQDTKVKMAFFNHDTSSSLVNGLQDYLKKNAILVNLPDDKKDLQDALFFKQIEYILTVPTGFTRGMLNGQPEKLERTMVPDSAGGLFLDQIVNKYLNTAKIYTDNIKNLTPNQLATFINNDISQKTDARLVNPVAEGNMNVKRAYYFNYMAYSLYAVLILGVCSVMMVFQKTDLRRRNLCSPMKQGIMNLQLMFGNLCFAFVVWLSLVITSFVLYGSYLFTARGLLHLLNSFIFTFAALSVGFLVSNIVKSKGAMSAAANVVALGSCFISGVFVPQEYLGETVQKIASFMPNYWYVKANNNIAAISEVNMKALMPIFTSMVIVAGFTLAILVVTLTIMKQKRTSN